MKEISAQIIQDSRNEFGDRIISIVCTFPRFILAELNTHRAFSRNSASSRAVPFNKMVEMVENDPFIPIAWQEDHAGMQGTQYLDDKPASYLSNEWTDQLKGKQILESIWAGSRNEKGQIYVERPLGTALYHAVECAKELNANKATKQLVNRLLEPFMWHTCIVTATEWESFFKLRCPQYSFTGKYFRSWKDLISHVMDEGVVEHQQLIRELEAMTILERLKVNKGQAEIHMMVLAEAIWDEINSSTPVLLKPGQWHIPFANVIIED